MKLNKQKIEEALRIRNELNNECNTLIAGITIAQNVVFPSTVFSTSRIYNWIGRRKYKALSYAIGACYRTQVAMNAIEIFRHNEEECSLIYNHMEIHSLEEYLQCRELFKSEHLYFFSVSESEVYWKTLGGDYKIKFRNQVTAFLNKIEEAFD